MSDKPLTPARALDFIIGYCDQDEPVEAWARSIGRKATAALPAAQAQEALIRNLVLALKLAPQPPMHATVWSFDQYIEWSETKAAVLARTKEAGYD